MRFCWWDKPAQSETTTGAVCFTQPILQHGQPAAWIQRYGIKALESKDLYEQGNDLGGHVHRWTSGLCDGAAPVSAHGGSSTACHGPAACCRGSATSGYRRAAGGGLCCSYLRCTSYWICLGVPSKVRLGLEAPSARMASWMEMSTERHLS